MSQNPPIHLSLPIHNQPVRLLQDLIRFDTTNPPGNEAGCIRYIEQILTTYDIETTLLAKDPARPNLVARLKGTGNAAPLLLFGHVDVVTTRNQTWSYPPFGGEIHDGYLWGRGAIDMKGPVVMFLTAFLRAKAEGVELPGDVILALVSDEENGAYYGARYLVEEHPEVFAGVRYALGEFGGFSLDIAGRRFYPIMTAERQACWLRLTVRGPSGHASTPIQGTAMGKAARMIERLEAYPLPVHITPVARSMVDSISAALPPALAAEFRKTLDPVQTERMLSQFGELGANFSPLVHNTVCPTIIHGGDKVNVIPGEVTLALDGRLLPGYHADDLLKEIRTVIGSEIDYQVEIMDYFEYPGQPDLGLWEPLCGVMREMDPNGIPMPMLQSGVTDGRFFARLGIQTYGFTPMQLPSDFNFQRTVHAADERIPVEALAFGSEAVFRALQRFGETGKA